MKKVLSKMYSIVLESVNKKQFLDFVSIASKQWTTDVLYSGSGYEGEDGSFCGIAPDDVLLIDFETSVDAMKQFAFGDNRETIGYISYDYGLFLQGVKSEKQQGIEAGQLKKYMAYAYHDGGTLKIKSISHQMLEKLVFLVEQDAGSDEYKYTSLRTNMAEDDYAEKVETVLEKIRGGHTYQLNLSMMFEADFEGSPFALWKSMAENFPAPFYAYINTIDGVVVSTSPERFIKVSDGDVLSQPIKGTHKFEEYYDGIEKILTESRKESAELSMIVDLIRNDISSCCEFGSVKVCGHKSILRVDDLLQMYSNVHGRLTKNRDVIDLLLSAFPGGSITGCPKKRSMETIDQLEPHTRGIYCGSIFRITDEKNMDSNIAIRTACIADGIIRFYAGSGIVADSQPKLEYKETISKARKFLELK